MKNYIALKPVRFDRSYHIGEEIPEGVISPGSVKRLIEQGRIALINATPPPSSPDEETTKTIAAFTEFVEAVEAELGVIYEDDELPGMDERMGECLGRMRNVSEALLRVVTDENQNPDAGQGAELNSDQAKTFQCPECEKTFATQQGLASHMRTHSSG